MDIAPGDSPAPAVTDLPTALRTVIARLRSLSRHRLVQSGLTLLGILALWKVARGDLSGWAVGLGMDEQRGTMVAALLAVLALACAATLAGARVATARAGALVGFALIEIVPFLVGAARTGSTGGLATSADVLGWVAQPLGMLLMAWIATTGGAAMGTLLRADAIALIGRLRRRRRIAPLVLVGLGVAMVLAVPAASTAVQDGSLTALYSYAVPGTGGTQGPALPHGSHSRSGVVAVVKGGLHAPPGHLQVITVAGRNVRVYLPATYPTDVATSYGVIYFLHGYPSTEMQWMSGAQLPGVLDQLIAARVIPPIIAVMPNGNGDRSPDAEWGDTARGDRIEDWLVNDVVPAIDAHYRTVGEQRRGIAGLSSGGYGALNVASHHPGVFDWAASYSGYFTARRDLFTGPAAAENSPLLTVTRFPRDDRMPVYIGVGTGDGHYLESNEQFGTELRRIGWEPVSFDVVPGGHGWSAWRLELVHSLEWLGTLWPPPPAHEPPGTPIE